MIHVDRGRLPAPEALVTPGGKADQERQANDALAAAGRQKDMSFKAYKDATVMSRLSELFHGKCAYCESRYEAQQPGDVEHFRPKAEVAVRGEDGKVSTKPGYHWLAADWSNLLPSCADCNRPRKHAIRAGAGKRVMGKANWFPVEPESRRATRAAQVRREPRLLIDPCGDQPGDHLAFDDDGTIHPRPRRGRPSRMGEATIEYCALARLELTQARHRRGDEVNYVIDNLLQAQADGDAAQVRRHAGRLSTMIDGAAEYSAYAAAIVDRRLGSLAAALGL